MNEPNVLYSKEGFIFTKIENNNYTLLFDIENNKIIIPKIIDFNLFKLIYQLNSDIYEQNNIDIINENEAISYLLMKNLFEDLGLPQRFSYIHVKKFIENDKISFISHSIKENFPIGVPIDSKLLPIKKMICECLIITQHKIQFSCNVTFDDDMNVPPFAEKIVGLILFKIFKRVKQFIENV
jgi:hypothetical protein